MVHVFFLGLQNLNDSFHFALQRTNNFFFVHVKLLRSSMIGMGFGCDMCVCGLGGVWLGHETCVTLGRFL
jgi:hypothetical protein